MPVDVRAQMTSGTTMIYLVIMMTSWHENAVALLALCERNPPVTSWFFPSQRVINAKRRHCNDGVRHVKGMWLEPRGIHCVWSTISIAIKTVLQRMMYVVCRWLKRFYESNRIRFSAYKVNSILLNFICMIVINYLHDWYQLFHSCRSFM